MAKGQLCIKVKSEAVRWMLNCVVMVSVFKNPVLMEHICGPFTLPVADKQHLIVFIIWIEVVRITYKGLLNLANRLPFLRWIPSYLEDLLTVKYLLVLTLKIFLIFEEEHRKKFYLHSFLLEGIILLTAILFDCLQKQNIKDAGELLLIDALHRLSLVYELTQTFCPNLILYYVVTNLLVFVMVQVESQLKYGLKESLYVKHDVYRFMFMTVLFFGLASLAQLASLNFKMLVTFLFCLKFLLAALKEYSESNQGAALNNLVMCGVILSLCEVVFLWVPFSLGTGQL